jgi:hypothetical protein
VKYKDDCRLSFCSDRALSWTGLRF